MPNPVFAPLALAVLLAFPASEAWAAGPWDDTCLPEPAGLTSVNHTGNLNTLYVPANAPVGTVIGTYDTYMLLNPDTPNQGYKCNNVTPVLFTADWSASAPIHSGNLPPIMGENFNGKTMDTQIPGVGIRIKMEMPYNGGTGDNLFQAVGEPVVPFQSIHNKRSGFYIHNTYVITRVTLVKTGPIPPGPQQFSQEFAAATITDLGRYLTVRYNATVIAGQCSLAAPAVSHDPVPLGTWPSADFTGPGFTTPATAFQINLAACEDDPSGNTSMAHIELTGTGGSTPIDPALGLFSLNSQSTARGVGIQVLRADGVTPVELNQPVPIQRIPSSGAAALPFTARFYQTGPSADVTPGTALGSLNFSITYQ